MSEDVAVTLARARVGTTLRDKWHIESLLGVGGMAAVYAGRHRNGMRGAVKILHRDLGSHTTIRSRFLREGYVANRIEHTGAVRVLDDDVAEDGSAFLVMELLTGQTLEALARSTPDRRLGVDEVLRIADDVLDVLVVAHAAGVIHRDIKPENLFSTDAGQLKVLDFGIAKLREPGQGDAITRTGHMLGTPEFMPPEQASGLSDTMDARTDLWALGATMFTLLTGRRVHEGETMQIVLMRAMSKPAPGLGEIAPELPAELATVVDRALAFEPDERYPDARSMQLAVRALRGSHRVDPTGATQAGTVATATPAAAKDVAVVASSVTLGALTGAPSIRRPSRRRVVGLVGLGALVAGGAAFAWVSRSGPQVDPTATAPAPATVDFAPTAPPSESTEPATPPPPKASATATSKAAAPRPAPPVTSDARPSASPSTSVAPAPTRDPYDRRR